MRRGRLEMHVHENPSLRVQRHTRVIETESVGVAGAPRGAQHLVHRQLRPAFETDQKRSSHEALDGADSIAKVDVMSLALEAGAKVFRHLVVEESNQRRTALDDPDARPERGKDARVFAA